MYAAPDIAVATAPDGSALLVGLATRAAHAPVRAITPELALLWRSLADGNQLDTAIRAVASHYDLDPDNVRDDMREPIGELLADGFLTNRRPHASARASETTAPPAVTRTCPPAVRELRRRELAAVAIGLTIGLVIWRTLPARHALTLMRACRHLRHQTPELATTTDLVAAATRLAARLPTHTDCLEISTAAYLAGVLLGQAPDWHLGTSFRPITLHAWVQVNETAIDHTPAYSTRTFATLASA